MEKATTENQQVPKISVSDQEMEGELSVSDLDGELSVSDLEEVSGGIAIPNAIPGGDYAALADYAALMGGKKVEQDWNKTNIEKLVSTGCLFESFLY